jgi:hypothetical protein
MLTRRSFLATTAATAAARAFARDSSPRKKIAFIGTVVHEHSHAQHFLDRPTIGYTWGGKWAAPRLDVASVYVDQTPRGDLLGDRIKRYKLRRFPTIAEALTLGGSKLAVDGVVIIGEHGNYPMNKKGQRLYPRYEWFKQVVKVFEASGRAVPVFNDKHLSTTWEHCTEMVADSKRLGFPFLAGSSLPVTWRLPSIDMPYDAPLVESVCVGYGGVDSYDFHGLETAQCMSDRRQGGETGIESVHAVRGAKLWEMLAAPDREVTRRLLVSALCCSHNLPVRGGYPTGPVTFEWARQTLPETFAYFIQHRDGLRTTLFMAPIRDFNYAGLRRDNGEIVACQMYLPMPTQSATTADFFNPLARHVETMVLNHRAPYPVERTLLTSGMLIGAVDSLSSGQIRVATPQMEVRYRGPRESQFRRE